MALPVREGLFFAGARYPKALSHKTGQTQEALETAQIAPPGMASHVHLGTAPVQDPVGMPGEV